MHVVDLDGALSGRRVNESAIASIVRAAGIPVQLGGGIRAIADIEAAFALGIERVILGTAAVRDPQLVEDACRKFGARIAVGIDARDGIVAVEGWESSGSMTAVDLATRMAAVGVERIIYTDIARDGTLSGVNYEATAALAETSRLKVIASGGVASLADIEALQDRASSGIEGVIIGKALYTGGLKLADALRVAGEA